MGTAAAHGTRRDKTGAIVGSDSYVLVVTTHDYDYSSAHSYVGETEIATTPGAFRLPEFRN